MRVGGRGMSRRRTYRRRTEEARGAPRTRHGEGTTGTHVARMQHTPPVGCLKREREGKRGIERERERRREREWEREGERGRGREGEKERERGGERGREREGERKRETE